MDANGLRFWMLADNTQWDLIGSPPAAYDSDRRSLRLRSERLLSPPNEPESADVPANVRLDRVPEARDRFGTYAYWDPTVGAIMAAGALPEAIPIFEFADGEAPTDLTLGYDDVLYIAVAGRVVMLDRRGRWNHVTLRAPDFSAWRIAPDPDGGVWALDRTRRKLGRVQGMPLPERPL